MNKKHIEEILQTTKGENETWLQVFDRVNTQRGIDIKVLALIIATLLQELEQ